MHIAFPFCLALTAGLTLGTQSVAKEVWLADPINGCEIAVDDSDGVGSAAISWSGACLDKKASRMGVVSEFNAGKLIARYKGVMQAGQMHGPGQLVFDFEGDYIDVSGTFENGLPMGEARVSWPNGDVMIGNLNGSLHEGRGIFIDANGGYIKTSWANGVVSGDAVYETVDGETFKGTFENNEPVEGTLTYPDGSRYQGPFADGLPSGQGILVTADGGTFFGGFVAGELHGAGRYVDADGVVFQGNFVNDNPDGELTVTKADGTVVTGVFKEGELIE